MMMHIERFDCSVQELKLKCTESWYLITHNANQNMGSVGDRNLQCSAPAGLNEFEEARGIGFCFPANCHYYSFLKWSKQPPKSL